MKKTNRESIGDLINKFDNQEIQTVETFNELFFNCKLVGYNSNSTVTIGEYNKGRRALLIDDTISVDHEFSLIDLTLGTGGLNPFLVKINNNEVLGRFYSLKEVANHMDLSYSTIRNYISNGKITIEELTND